MSATPPAGEIDQPEPGIKSAEDAARITAKLSEHPSRIWLEYALACFIGSADGPCVGVGWILANPEKFAALFDGDWRELYQFMLAQASHRDFAKLFEEPRIFTSMGIPVLPGPGAFD